MSKKEIVQSKNEVIVHQNVARFKGILTPVQSRSMLSILKRANEQVTENPDILDFTIPSDVFLEDIQNKSTAGLNTIVTQLNKHLKTLMVQLFEWGTIKEPECCIFMQQIKVTEKEVTFTFSNYIREHIKPISSALIIKDFVLIQSFRSEYARQLYKHLMMWEKQQSLYLSVKDFKDFLGVPPTKSYERMEVLKRKVLNVAIAEINEKCPYIDLKYINRTQNRSKKIEGFDFAWLNEQVQPSKVKQNPLFTVEDPMDYTDYYGMNCKIKNMVCEHLLVITPLTDGSINCSFRSGENYHFASIENLLETKIGIISRRKGA